MVADCNPKWLLSLKFVKAYAYPYLVLTVAAAVIFFMVIFIDVFQYILVAAGCTFKGGPMTSDEESLNIAARFCQAFIVFTFICFINVCYHARKRTQLRR